MDYVALSNGLKMPKLGYGVFQVNPMEKYGVCHESWGPFAEGRKDFFNNEVLVELAKNHKKSSAQIALRFLLQSDVVVIPKSIRKERMEENINVFEFELSEDDMKEIRGLDERTSLFFSHYDVEPS